MMGYTGSMVGLTRFYLGCQGFTIRSSQGSVVYRVYGFSDRASQDCYALHPINLDYMGSMIGSAKP